MFGLKELGKSGSQSVGRVVSGGFCGEGIDVLSELLFEFGDEVGIETGGILVGFEGLLSIESLEVELFAFGDNSVGELLNEAVDFLFESGSRIGVAEVELAEGLSHSSVDLVLVERGVEGLVQEVSIPGIGTENTVHLNSHQRIQLASGVPHATGSQVRLKVAVHKVVPLQLGFQSVFQ